MNTTKPYVLAAALVAVFALPARAHHSFSAEFDESKPITLQGKVTKMEWINPHSWIHIDVAGEDGKPVPWMIEAGTPNTMVRRGLHQRLVEGRHRNRREGFLSKDGANRANGFSITFTDGRQFIRRRLGAGNTPDQLTQRRRAC